MSALIILLAAIVVLFSAYKIYGRFLSRTWGVDPSKTTPAQNINDGVDYSPTKRTVLIGHHFASIAGASTINGPIQAAIFGWLPVLLWILIGGVFFGAVHDFGSIFASVRHGGKSIGHVIEVNTGKNGKRLFLAFAWFTLLLVIGSFISIVQGTFTVTAEQLRVGDTSNGSVATASLLFILLAVAFGFLVNRRKTPLLISSVIGILLIIVCIMLGLYFPVVGISANVWLIFLMAYMVVASVTPVWILLQPRDYLNSFLLYGMMLLAAVGVVFANPTVEIEPIVWNKAGTMFPVLFVMVTCGAISGFHSLVGSGTTSKQIENESDIKPIGFGAMLIECALAVIALIAVGALGGQQGTPAVTFAMGISGFFTALGAGEAATSAVYTIITLSVSAFALTSLDTSARMGRFLFQELLVNEGEQINSLKGIRKILVNPYVSTIITVVLGGGLALGGYERIWPLFGAANQLLAGLSMLAISVWLGRIGKKNSMFYIPMGFMMLATLTSLTLSLVTQIKGLIFKPIDFDVLSGVLQSVFASLLIALALVLAFEAIRALAAIRKTCGKR